MGMQVLPFGVCLRCVLVAPTVALHDGCLRLSQFKLQRLRTATSLPCSWHPNKPDWALQATNSRGKTVNELQSKIRALPARR
jgi:hypothetical protein